MDLDKAYEIWEKNQLQWGVFDENKEVLLAVHYNYKDALEDSENLSKLCPKNNYSISPVATKKGPATWAKALHLIEADLS